jgi:uncharacterized protein (DUF697 family)
MSYIPKALRAKCHAIIHAASAAAGAAGTGLAQLPCSDSVVITPIQTAMIISLGHIFGLTLSLSTAEAALATATTCFVGRGISQLLIGWIPGIGNVINATTAASLTEGIGWLLAEQFAREAAAE